MLWVLCAALVGCKRESIQVYEVSKEKPPTRPEAAGMGAPMPELRWAKLPEGWASREVPNRMRAANFTISGSGGRSAELSVIPLQGMGGNDLEFVNMWRQQIGLGPVEENSLAKYMSPIQIGGLEGKLFDMRGSEAAQSSDPNGVLVAVLVREGVTWFFKLAGEETLVQAQRPVLLQFLQGVSFAEPSPDRPIATAGGGASEAPSGGGDAAMPAWSVPAGWQPASPGPMVLSKFVVHGEASAKADVSVSRFPGDVGGMLANVNRWRGQVGLDALSAESLATETQSLSWEGGKGTVVDVLGTDVKTGQPARLVGVIVPVNGNTWFYKLMGAPAVCEREKASLLKFVQSAKYGNAP